MSGLRPPPKEDTPSRAVGRIVFLVFLLALLGAVIWAAVVQQRISLVETQSLAQVEDRDVETVDELDLNIVEQGSGTTTVVLLHDAEITGSPIFTDLVTALGPEVTTLGVDLPGFGLSTRLPGADPRHTVADMAQKMASVIETSSGTPVILVGVGLGGEVAAEVAVTHPDLVAGLVMVDVDFYEGSTWVQRLERIPWFGTSVTHAVEASGSFSASNFAPYCEVGGWCPDAAILTHRALTTSILETTDSLNGFIVTDPASDVPSRLGAITAPTVFVWSQKGAVPEDSVDRVISALPAITLERIDAYQAHLDEPGTVAGLIQAMIP